MSDDLLKRLDFASFKIFFEVKAAIDRIEHLENRCANLLVENGILNNRIEKLEAALREIAEMGYWDDDSTRIARKALDAE